MASKIAYMAIAQIQIADPSGARRFQSFDPLVIANRVPPQVSVRGSGHLDFANSFQERPAAPGRATLCLFFTVP